MLSTSNENIISITEKASNITISDITLQSTRSDALNIAGENCKIVNCTVKNAAECGINVSGKNNLVENCEVAFIGKDAVVLSGGSAEGFVYGNNTVTDNSLHDYGEIQKTYISGVEFKRYRQQPFPIMNLQCASIWVFTIQAMKNVVELQLHSRCSFTILRCRCDLYGLQLQHLRQCCPL